MPPPHFNWPPFKLVRLDADTGKPLDPNVGMRVYREFYDIKKDKHGKNVVVAHKSGNGGSKKGEAAAEGGEKKDGNGKNGNGNGNGNKNANENKGGSKSGGEDKGGEKKDGEGDGGKVT